MPLTYDWREWTRHQENRAYCRTVDVEEQATTSETEDPFVGSSTTVVLADEYIGARFRSARFYNIKIRPQVNCEIACAESPSITIRHTDKVIHPIKAKRLPHFASTEGRAALQDSVTTALNIICIPVG